jgi:hypothetical protein
MNGSKGETPLPHAAPCLARRPTGKDPRFLVGILLQLEAQRLPFRPGCANEPG